MPEQYGKCDREINCGYHNNPYKDGFAKENIKPHHKHTLKRQASPIPPSFISNDIFSGTLRHHDENNFVQFLITHFGKITATDLIERYYIGSSKHWHGATVFWQIDISKRIRTGKIMLYHPQTGKRVKEGGNHINWVHSVLKMPAFNLKQCFFGEHLLKCEPLKPVAIVESEKTAIIASAYIPEYTWMAAGGLANLSFEKCEVLRNRNVTLFPDVNCFDKWTEKARELSCVTNFIVSTLLEQNATEIERQKGLDIADYLIETQSNKHL
ncbi:hypothetical protein DN068_07535 [Taibaiella soli]|uniref:Toprim domain-containing protein n=1 Tax=Taibaiella soli TaxID=1649169 RepID=A0A2W2ADN8_9BACT|nr:hypothetical protein DN068_07535 [Taibaiella soli]